MKKILFFVLILQSAMLYSQTKVIAHRGAFKANNLPENSLASLQQAAKIGCYASEFDVHITKDGELVVNHNDDINGILIATSNFSDIRKQKLANGELLPTLEEYLKEGIKFKDMRLVLEVKKSNSQENTLEAARKSVEMVKKLNLENKVDYITFDFEAGKLIAKLSPGSEIGYLEGNISPRQAKEAGFNSIDYHYSVFIKNPNWIKEAQDLNMTVNAWTVNDKKDMEFLIQHKIDYITTNEPEILLDL